MKINHKLQYINKIANGNPLTKEQLNTIKSSLGYLGASLADEFENIKETIFIEIFKKS